MINYSKSDDMIDYKKWIDSEENPKSQIIKSLLDSSTISDVYNVVSNHSDPSSGDSYITKVEFNEDTNTFKFTFNDESTVSATVKTSVVDLSEYVTKDDLNNKVSEIQSDTQWKKSVPTYNDISKTYPTPSDGWTVNVDDTDITYRYTGSEWIPISSNSIPLATHELDGKMSSSDKVKLDELSNYDDTEIRSELANSVKYSEFDGGRKTIQLKNHDTISGVTTSGSGVNLAMVSKWDKADFGSSTLPINLNGSESRPTYNDNEPLALLSDMNSLGIYSLGKIESFGDVPAKLADKDICSKAENSIITFVVSNSTYGDESGICRNIYTQGKSYQTLFWKNEVYERTLDLSSDLVEPSEFIESSRVYLSNKAVSGPKLFALTTKSSESDIKAALTGTISKSLITSDDLDKCYKYGYLIREEVMNGSVIVGWTGSAYSLTQVGVPNPSSVEQVSRSIFINVTKEGKYSVVRDGVSSKILTDKNSVTKFDSKVDKVEGKSLISESDAAVIPSLLSRISQLEDKVTNLGKSNIESSTISGSPSDSYSDNSKDYVIDGSVSTGTLTVNGKSVLLSEVTISDGARVKLTSSTDSEIKSSSITGDFPKSGGNTIVSMNGSDYVTIKGCNIDATSYNVIEVGLNEENLPKSVLIDGCNFTGEFSNNAILIFGTSDNAVININNCHFHKVSNVLRISNRSNTKCTINITNCSCDEWESNLEYTGMILCQDYTSGSLAKSNNLFSPDKIKINISNFTLPNGSRLSMPSDVSSICGSGTSDQIIYVYNEVEGVIKYGDGSRYPSISIS